MIRNLLDLPHTASALRHIYLRVLYPLLAHTQLREEGSHYKKEQLQRVLRSVGGSWHFGEVDETTARLVGRCWRIEWLSDGAPEDLPVPEFTESPVTMTVSERHVRTLDGDPISGSSQDFANSGGAAATAQHLLSRPYHPSASVSNLSVVEVAAQTERPGVQMPSRHHTEDSSSAIDSVEVVVEEAVKQRRPSRQGPPVAPRRKGRRKIESGDSNAA